MTGVVFFFFFQAEDGIRDLTVTGVQTCALPISGLRQGALNPRGPRGLARRDARRVGAAAARGGGARGAGGVGRGAGGGRGESSGGARSLKKKKKEIDGS